MRRIHTSTALIKQLHRQKMTLQGFIHCRAITNFYTYLKPNYAIMYAQQGISLARKMKTDMASSSALRSYANVLSVTGDYPQAIYFELEALKLAEKANDFLSLGWSYSYLAGHIYRRRRF